MLLALYQQKRALFFAQEWRNNWSLICCTPTDPAEDLKELVGSLSGGFKRSMSLRAAAEIVLDKVQGSVIEILAIDNEALPAVAGLGDDIQEGFWVLFCTTV